MPACIRNALVEKLKFEVELYPNKRTLTTGRCITIIRFSIPGLTFGLNQFNPA